VNTLLKAKLARREYVTRIEGTHWPTHPVCFFSALSLEKNTPSESA